MYCNKIIVNKQFHIFFLVQSGELSGVHVSVGVQEEERRGEEKDERKRKYNVTHNDEVR